MTGPQKQHPKPAAKQPLGFASRNAALRLLSGVQVERRMMSDLIASPELGIGELPPPDRARAQRLASGVLRHLTRLDAIIDPHLDRPPPLRARNALRLAAWEILVDGVAPHAAVDMAVTLSRAGQKTARFAGLVNAVARKLPDMADVFAAAPPPVLPKPLRTPLIKAVGKARTLAIEAAHLSEPPVDITPRDPADLTSLADRLGGVVLPTGSIRLRQPGQITALPGFAEGEWWVQDAAAAIPARLLGDVAGARVLDLCAAPGGKTMQLAAAGAAVTAVDSAAARLPRLKENLLRTGLSAEVVKADATRWMPEGRFDAILLDAPCSATGTIRRHPDLPHLRDNTDLRPLFALQETLLRRALDWLTPGGRLMYCTCSLLPGEGEFQVAKITETAATIPVNAAAAGIPDDWITDAGHLRSAPDFWADKGGVDGFFAAILTAR